MGTINELAAVLAHNCILEAIEIREDYFNPKSDLELDLLAENKLYQKAFDILRHMKITIHPLFGRDNVGTIIPIEQNEIPKYVVKKVKDREGAVKGNIIRHYANEYFYAITKELPNTIDGNRGKQMIRRAFYLFSPYMCILNDTYGNWYEVSYYYGKDLQKMIVETALPHGHLWWTEKTVLSNLAILHSKITQKIGNYDAFQKIDLAELYWKRVIVGKGKDKASRLAFAGANIQKKERGYETGIAEVDDFSTEFLNWVQKEITEAESVLNPSLREVVVHGDPFVENASSHGYLGDYTLSGRQHPFVDLAIYFTSLYVINDVEHWNTREMDLLQHYLDEIKRMTGIRYDSNEAWNELDKYKLFFLTLYTMSFAARGDQEKAKICYDLSRDLMKSQGLKELKSKFEKAIEISDHKYLIHSNH